MSLFKVKAKVLLSSEEQMEAEEKYDMGTVAESKNWVWRDVSVPFEEVYKITSFDKEKSIVQTYDGDKMLVKETFAKLNEKWEELREKFSDYSHREWEETKEEDD